MDSEYYRNMEYLGSESDDKPTGEHVGEKFILEFDTVNDGASNRNAVSIIIDNVANSLAMGYDGGPVMDINGNKVGEWEWR